MKKLIRIKVGNDDGMKNLVPRIMEGLSGYLCQIPAKERLSFDEMGKLYDEPKGRFECGRDYAIQARTNTCGNDWGRVYISYHPLSKEIDFLVTDQGSSTKVNDVAEKAMAVLAREGIDFHEILL